MEKVQIFEKTIFEKRSTVYDASKKVDVDVFFNPVLKLDFQHVLFHKAKSEKNKQHKKTRFTVIKNETCMAKHDVRSECNTCTTKEQFIRY